MTANTIGEVLKVTTWGESHGKAIGVVIDGCPAGIPLTEEDIQKELDKRKPGQTAITDPFNFRMIMSSTTGETDGLFRINQIF